MTKLITNRWFLIILFLIPVFTFLSSRRSIEKLSLNWIGGNYDPSYAYLLNALSNACLKQADHIDHPGTPMQVFAAAIIKTTHFFEPKPKPDLQTAVLTNPEHYLLIVTFVCLFFSCCFLFFMGYMVYHFTQNIWYGLVFQLSPYYSNMILFHGMLRLSQEIFLMLAVFAMATSIIVYLSKEGSDHHKRFSLLFGIIAGFGIASKIVYMPVLLLPFFLLPGLLNKIKLLSWTVVGFVLFTLPIINKYKDLFNWVKALYQHAGTYGGGAKTVIDPHTFLIHLKQMWYANIVFSITIVISILFLFIFTVLKRRREFLENNKNYTKALLLAVIVEVCGLLVTAKHPNERYLMPYEALCGFNVFLILFIVKTLFPFSKKIELLFIPLLVLLLMIMVPYDGIRERDKLLSGDANAELVMTYKVFTGFDSNYIRIFSLPSSSKEAALYLGSVFSGGKHVWYLNKIYPLTYFVNTENLNFKRWDGSNVDFDKIPWIKNKKIVILNMNDWAAFDENSKKEFIEKFRMRFVSLYSGKHQSIMELVKF